MATPLIECAQKNNSDLWSEFYGEKMREILKFAEEWLHYCDNCMNHRKVTNSWKYSKKGGRLLLMTTQIVDSRRL
jgi:fructose-1,6-bisphosphatase